MPIYKTKKKKDGLQGYRVVVNYTDSSGNYHKAERTAYGLEAAKETERKLTLELKEKGTTKRITVQNLYDEYILTQRNEIRESSLQRTERTMKIHILPHFADLPLNSLTLPKLQSWKNKINEELTPKGQPFAISYKQKIYSVFRAMLNYAVKMEYINTNPLSKLGNFKDVNSVKHDMDFYTSDEFLKFIHTAKDIVEEAEKNKGSIYEWNFYVFFNIAFYTGMRKGEINALKWSDISGNTINITRSISQKLKGGDRETPPKNNSSIRTVQIPAPLKKILDEHKKRCKTLPGYSDDWRICGGESCIRDSTLENRNKTYAEKAGLKKIRIHDYRHSHASLLANQGINIQEIARRLGHNNIEMTWNIYSHLYPLEEERALEILNKIC